MEMRIQGGHGCRGLANHNVVSGTSYNGAVRLLGGEFVPRYELVSHPLYLFHLSGRLSVLLGPDVTAGFNVRE